MKTIKNILKGKNGEVICPFCKKSGLKQYYYVKQDMQAYRCEKCKKQWEYEIIGYRLIEIPWMDL
jgi:transposase-like protein